MFYEQLYKRRKQISVVGVKVPLKCYQMPTPMYGKNWPWLNTEIFPIFKYDIMGLYLSIYRYTYIHTHQLKNNLSRKLSDSI